MVHHYRAADVLLVASRQEGSPNVVKEALACNLPVVSTAVGDVNVRLRGVSPSVVVDREPGAIAEALVDILRQGTRCNGREHVESLGQRETAMRVLDVYQRVISGTGSTRNRQTARPVQPQTVSSMSEGDLPEVIAVHRNAFQGYMNTSLGGWYLRRFLGWFAATENAIALVARDQNSECSGYVVGAPVGYQSQLNRQLLVPAAFGLVSHPWVVLERRVQRAVVARLSSLLANKRRFSDSNSSLPPPTISLVGIGVTAKAQGTGAGSRLMEAFQDEARSMGMCSMRLSVYPDNTAARKLYEKNGWTPLTDSESPRVAMFYTKIMSPAA
jgi:ribosomal protein S18 acetylase RimI-like enzyme